MATNEVTSLRNALVALLLADTTLRTITGRTSGFVVTWQTIATATRPVIAYLMTSSVRDGGKGHRRRVQVFLGAYATGNTAQDKVEAMTRRAREVLTKTAFATQSVYAEVMEATERGADPLSDVDSETQTQEARHDLDLIIEMDAPL
jgi:hypothetical protein